MDSGRDRTEGDRHSPTRPRRQFLPACLHRLELPDRNGHAAARFRRPLPRRRCPPECATRPTILRVKFRNVRLVAVCFRARFSGGRRGCSIARRLRSRSDRALTAASVGAHFQPNQKCTFEIGLRPYRGFEKRRTFARAHVVAGILGMRTAQAEAPYPSEPEALAAEAAGAGPTAAALVSVCGACPTCVGRPMTMVEMACLKINCSWPLASSTTEYLSKERMRPVSLTPLRR